jgi:hypothetical protein
VAILHEERFLAKCVLDLIRHSNLFRDIVVDFALVGCFLADGWSTTDVNLNPASMKAKLLSIVKAIRLVMMCKCVSLI